MLNAYAAVIAIFDAVFKTNYMYLCNKPAGASIMDFLARGRFTSWHLRRVALIIFWLLWLPVRHYCQTVPPMVLDSTEGLVREDLAQNMQAPLPWRERSVRKLQMTAVSFAMASTLVLAQEKAAYSAGSNDCERRSTP